MVAPRLRSAPGRPGPCVPRGCPAPRCRRDAAGGRDAVAPRRRTAVSSWRPTPWRASPSRPGAWPRPSSGCRPSCAGAARSVPARAATTRATGPSPHSRPIRRERPGARPLSSGPRRGTPRARLGRAPDLARPAAIVFFANIPGPAERSPDAGAMYPTIRRHAVVRPGEFLARLVGLGVDQRLEYRPGDRRHPAPALGERIDGPGLALPLHPAHQRGRANLEAGGDDRVRLGARLVRTHGTYPELSGIRIRHARNRSQRRSHLK